MKQQKTKKQILKEYNKSDYARLERFFKRIEKIWQPEFGKECHTFCPNCCQCKFNLIYNKFKQDIFDEALK